MIETSRRHTHWDSQTLFGAGRMGRRKIDRNWSGKVKKKSGNFKRKILWQPWLGKISVRFILRRHPLISKSSGSLKTYGTWRCDVRKLLYVEVFLKSFTGFKTENCRRTLACFWMETIEPSIFAQPGEVTDDILFEKKVKSRSERFHQILN